MKKFSVFRAVTTSSGVFIVYWAMLKISYPSVKHPLHGTGCETEQDVDRVVNRLIKDLERARYEAKRRLRG